MKNIEEIREKLGPDYRIEEKDGVITVCDIWDGVEFAECVSNNFTSFIHGEIYPISMIDGEWIYTKYDEKLSSRNGLHKTKIKPSTEAAYVEQLKAKAKELYGEIKDGDRFDLTDIGGISYVGIQLKGCPTFVYIKRKDELFLNGYRLYSEGKWAKKIEERVKVEVEDWVSTTNAKFESFDFRVKMRVKPLRPFDSQESAFYLSKCLEEYLNKS